MAAPGDETTVLFALRAADAVAVEPVGDVGRVEADEPTDPQEKALASRRQAAGCAGGSRQAFQPAGPLSSAQVVRQIRSRVSSGFCALPVGAEVAKSYVRRVLRGRPFVCEPAILEDELAIPQARSVTTDCLRTASGSCPFGSHSPRESSIQK